MATRQDDIKSTWEDKTLTYFLTYSAEQGGPTYQLVERRERPDRVIRAVDGSELIGVEITRIVEGEDAKLRGAVFRLGAAMKCVLEEYAKGGRVDLYSGKWPDLSKKGREDLCGALREAIEHAGSLVAFVDSLPRRKWQYGRSVFDFRQIGERDGWKFDNNTPHTPQARRSREEVICDMLLERVQDKIAKCARYDWTGPMFLLVRNTYQAIQPPDEFLEETRRLLAGSLFQRAWLVNHTEGTIDAEPPEPRLVDLGP